MPKFSVEEFKPQEATDELWENYCEFYENDFKFLYPDDPLPNREWIIRYYKTKPPQTILKHFIVRNQEDRIVGAVELSSTAETSPRYEDNKHICEMLMRALLNLPDPLPEEIGMTLLVKATEEAKAWGKTVIETWTNNDSGRVFFEKYGATLTITGVENRVELKDIDWNLMKTWVEEGKKRAKGVTVESFSKCPEEIIDEFTKMILVAAHEQPQGEIEYKATFDSKLRREWEEYNEKMGYIRHTLIAREEDGRLSGHTEISYDPNYSKIIIQRGTGVLPEFRGRGIGKMIKAMMLFHIKANYPKVERIISGNADANDAMLSINDRIGFKTYKSSSGYKFKVDELVERLGLKKK